MNANYIEFLETPKYRLIKVHGMYRVEPITIKHQIPYIPHIQMPKELLLEFVDMVANYKEYGFTKSFAIKYVDKECGEMFKYEQQEYLNNEN